MPSDDPAGDAKRRVLFPKKGEKTTVKKEEYLKKLGKKLRKLKNHERTRQLEYFDEILTDMMENGMTEEEAVEKIGDLEKTAKEILEQCDRESFKGNDPKGMGLVAVTVLCGIGSLGFLAGHYLRSGISISYIGGADGPTSVFIAGKIGQPVWLYGMTVFMVGATAVYFWRKKHL